MISTGKWSRSGLSLAFSFLQFRGLNPSRFSRIWLVKSGEIQTFPTEVGQVVTFLPPYVVHDRVAHDYLKDFQSEADLQKLGLRGLKSGDCMWLFSGGFVIFFPTGMVTIGDFIVSDGDLMVTWWWLDVFFVGCFVMLLLLLLICSHVLRFLDDSCGFGGELVWRRVWFMFGLTSPTWFPKHAGTNNMVV